MKKKHLVFLIILLFILLSHNFLTKDKTILNTTNETENNYESEISIDSQLSNTYCNNQYYTGRSLVVTIQTQRVYVYEPVKNENDGVYACKVIDEFPTTSGKTEKPTPTGVFYLGRSQKAFIKNYQVDFIPFKYEVLNDVHNYWGFHQAPWQDQSHIGEIGYEIENGSDGCLNIKNKDWQKLTSYIFTGLQIIIKQS